MQCKNTRAVSDMSLADHILADGVEATLMLAKERGRARQLARAG